MKTVLVIDDSDNMRLTIKEILTNNGYSVVGEAGDGRAGVEMFKELGPDYVTMDVTMSEMNGIEALKQIMKLDAGAKVVMVSAMGQDLFVRDAIKAGAMGFIVKPFSERQITDTLNNM